MVTGEPKSQKEKLVGKPKRGPTILSRRDKEVMRRNVKLFQKDPEHFRAWAREKALYAVQVLPKFFEKPQNGRSTAYNSVIGAIREFKELMVLIDEGLGHASTKTGDQSTVHEDPSWEGSEDESAS